MLWVAIWLFAEYFFRNLEFVRKNFALVILAIAFALISILPGVAELLRACSRAGDQADNRNAA